MNEHIKRKFFKYFPIKGLTSFPHYPDRVHFVDNHLRGTFENILLEIHQHLIPTNRHFCKLFKTFLELKWDQP